MTPKDLDKLIEKYLEGNCTPKERKFIETWYASLGSERQNDSADGSDLTETGNRILQHIATQTTTTNPSARHRALWYYSGIAASLLILLSAIYYSSMSRIAVEGGAIAEKPAIVEFVNDESQSQRAVLPDGTIVLISPNSTIRYLTTTDAGPRETLLEGEAYFDVAHDSKRPFFVYTGEVVTRVLGTSFVIRNRGGNDRITVSVKTGKVTVYSRKTAHKKTVLTPNQEASYDSSRDLLETQLAATPAHDERAEKLGAEMHFEETPIPDVFGVLIETYGIGIDFPADVLSKCVLTSSFYEEGLYDRIEAICTAIGATYEVVDARIIIESEGCNMKTQ